MSSGVDHQAGVSPRVDRPAHDPAAERIQDGTAVQPPFTGAVLRNVGYPQLIWGETVELAIDQIISGDHAAQPLDPNWPGSP
jgi:hypothetical protein